MSLVGKQGDKQAVAPLLPAEMVFYRTAEINEYVIRIGIDRFSVSCGEAKTGAVGCHTAIVLDTVEAVY